MSVLAVKRYFESQCLALGLKQIKEPFGSLEVPKVSADGNFHVFVTSVSGLERQNQAYDLETQVDVKIYQKDKLNADDSLNKLIQRSEALFISCLNQAALNGIIAITLDRIDYESLNEVKNDNFLIGIISFRVRHIVCTDE